MANKPVKPKPLTDEEKKQQIVRFFAQKRESYFQLILANSIQAGTHPKQAVDLALEATDYAIEKLFPVPNKED